MSEHHTPPPPKAKKAGVVIVGIVAAIIVIIFVGYNAFHASDSAPQDSANPHAVDQSG